jgi:hypothetical protein
MATSIHIYLPKTVVSGMNPKQSKAVILLRSRLRRIRKTKRKKISQIYATVIFIKTLFLFRVEKNETTEKVDEFNKRKAGRTEMEL